MQLNPRKPGRIAAGLGLMTTALLAGGSVAEAQDSVSSSGTSLMTEGVAEPGTTTVDTAVLFYQEQGGRVRAIEPSTEFTANMLNGDTISGSLTFDSLTGATPNGAAPWTSPQTFTSIQPAPSTQVTSTSASGNRIVTTVPGTGLVQSTYTVAANTLPMDAGFKDHRFAGTLGYGALLDPDTRLKFGCAASVERDYQSYSGNLGISRDLFGKNTTVSLAANLEWDKSKPYYGTPTGFQALNSQVTGGNDSKTVISVVAGVTQTLTRFWLTQLNYSYGSSKGYQTDPYKVLSEVDGQLGTPLQYIYENRPRSRTRQSVYWGNKIALGPTVADVSLRYYHDSWGIDSITAEASEQIPLGRNFYVEPLFRYYHQSAANFYVKYLISGAALPAYASADGRLSRFNATTLGVKAGVRLFEGTELYLDAEDYRQSGDHLDPGAPGALATLDMFPGVHALSVITGLRVKFE
ncbi:MAG: DUF3570 domain-containing protein [Sphingomonadales bacterium]|nr:DUF3570 domain-containing protein [Sphingomonadales bacterium]MDE2568987.1 DUF3570 domain-containing protein [Sphingomonadales bacterium]